MLQVAPHEEEASSTIQDAMVEWLRHYISGAHGSSVIQDRHLWGYLGMWCGIDVHVPSLNVLGNLPAECFIIDEATTIASSGRARYMCFAQRFPSQVITDNIQALPNQENLVSERTTIKKPKMSVSVMSGHKDVLLATKRDMREVSEHQSHVLHFVLLYKDEVILPNDSLVFLVLWLVCCGNLRKCSPSRRHRVYHHYEELNIE